VLSVVKAKLKLFMHRLLYW